MARTILAENNAPRRAGAAGLFAVNGQIVCFDGLIERAPRRGSGGALDEYEIPVDGTRAAGGAGVGSMKAMSIQHTSGY